MYNILFLRPGPVPPPTNPEEDALFHLSAHCRGDVLLRSWDQPSLNNPETRDVGSFRYHFCYSSKLPRAVKTMWEISFLVWKGVRLHFGKEKYQAIVSYGTNRTGFAACILQLLTGAKLIIEFPGNPATAFIADSRKRSFFDQVKNRIANMLVRVATLRAHHLRLLYPDQVAPYSYLDGKPRSVFHEFTTISQHTPSDIDDNFIYCLGGPWYLKGVDVLIKAFQAIKEEYPDIRLIVVGWDFGDEAYFDGLADGEPRIELRRPGLKKAAAMDLMSRCTLLVLPSRTEGMGRVLLEAMAYRKAVVAAKVDGIPHYLEHQQCGLLFESENVEQLADCLRQLLANPQQRQHYAAQGFEMVQRDYSESSYVSHFSKMLTRVIDDTE